MAPRAKSKDDEASMELAVIQPAPKSIVADMAAEYHMEKEAFEAALRATVVPSNCSPPQFAAFLMVARQYGLSPLTKEIYAFPSRGGGIVPIVSVDGWVNLVNSQGQCDGFTFEMEHDDKNNLVSCTCSMYRKDRKHPIVVTEYLAECVRSTDPWKMKHRMLRHKTLIQAARYAFGFSGIYDEDEGQKIAEIDPNKDMGPPRTAAEPQKVIQQSDAAVQDVEAEQARDGTPPRRSAPVTPPDDPDPPRDVAKDEQLSDIPPAPHQVPGKGHTYETWSDKYCDLLKTSHDTSAVMLWIDKNQEPLDRLAKGKPSEYAKIKKVTQNLIDDMRAKQDKAQTKAEAKVVQESSGDMDGGDQSEFPTDPEEFLKLLDKSLGEVTDPHGLEDAYARFELHVDDMFPSDRESAAGIYRRHEARLEP